MKQERIQVAVIGAGPSGLAAAKNCLEAGLDVVVFEKNDQVGGNWVFQSKTGHSSVYENTHIISSKAWSEYEDFPMPEDYPDYPSHAQLQAYFQDYATHFEILDVIRFQTEVVTVEPEKDGFLVSWRDALNEKSKIQQQHFTHVMVANGHHWCPRHPQLPGTFSGTYLHSHDFKRVSDDWRDKAVLVIGAGNSACDVAVETARVAKSVHLSMRNPQWFLPKFMFGMPSDVLGAKTPQWFPRRLKQRLMTWLVRLLQGDYEKQYGLPKPKYPLLSHHPTVNSDLLDFIRHGRITPQRAIASVDGRHVTFTDGNEGEYDIMVACTGFRTVFPFFREDVIDFEDAEKLPLYLKMMHQSWERLYFIGLFQPLGCIWPLADYQAKLAVREIQGLYRRPLNMGKAIQREIDHPHYRFEGGARHAAEVDYHQFREELRSALAMSGLEIGEPPQGKKGHYKNFSTRTAKHP
ncbi:FAD-binding protein [Aliidiomarina halalkaliphila]|uniref:FAD-binding protein n=1 Tax=Aliidiomarina halalkaliphila TaxID=2593535 RepID=A0A552WYT5_9GAMM|nr:NAD(P)-binding domain-containing protein [Aliidiomarina halalkaliphila]TRW47978.1 FAD-binding protein [Aliidiomarina halalkaliphila]